MRAKNLLSGRGGAGTDFLGVLNHITTMFHLCVISTRQMGKMPIIFDAKIVFPSFVQMLSAFVQFSTHILETERYL